MSSTRPLHVLIAGGGVAGVEAVLALRHFAGDRVRLELMTPAADLVRRQESVRTPFGGAAAPRLPLERLAALGVDLRHDTLAAVDAARREVRTRDGAILRYDRLVVATGAHAVESIAGATHFRGPISAGKVEALVAAGPVTFAMPAGPGWPLPLYELALQAATQGAGVRLVTPELRPLDVLGSHAADAVARLLDRAGVDVLTGVEPQAVLDGELLAAGGRFVAPGPVVALTRPQGPRIAGLGYDARGFLAVDEHGRVPGAPGVFAAGDVTTNPVKQGGLATQQADAVAAAIADDAGAPVPPAPAGRVLRTQLVTGGRPLYLRRLPGSAGEVSTDPLWTPAGKVAGRFLAGFLAHGDPDQQLHDLRLPLPVS